MELEIVPPLAPAEHEALIRALVGLDAEGDGLPPAYRSAWRRTGVDEDGSSWSPGEGLHALAAEHTWRDSRVVEP